MDPFEVAVLRILVKRQQPIKFSALVGGFPDDCEDHVLSAISALERGGYIVISDCGPEGYIMISRSKRREILQVVESDIGPGTSVHNDPGIEGQKVTVPTPRRKVGSRTVAGFSRRAIGIAAVSLFVIGLLGTGFASQTASSGQELAGHHGAFHYHLYAYSFNAPDSKTLVIDQSASPVFAAWQCRDNATSQNSY